MNAPLSIITMMQLTTMILIIVFLAQNKHFLMMLLALEAITLSLVMYVSLIQSMNNNNMPFLSLVILTFGACESSMGLSLLVKMSRYSGSDMLKSVSLNKC